MPTASTSSSPNQDGYSSWVGLIYVFNLIVGTGALTLPSVFAKAGWLLSSVLIIFLSFVGFITVTFVIETMAVANATIQIRKLESHKIDGESEAARDSESETEETNEQTAIINSGNRNMRRYFSLNQPVEMGQMAGLYFNKLGRILFFASLCIYLYGDLAIYATAISKSMSDLLCPNNHTEGNLTNIDDEFNIDCFNNRISKVDLYRICVGIFAFLVCPFTYFNVQKTKYFQLATTSMRWSAFTIMIVLASLRLYHHENADHQPPMFTFHGLPVLIGASVYSFMCHHSLPGLIAPFNDKQFVLKQLAMDYGLICTFYLLLSLTGVFAFRELNDLYTLNFVPTGDESLTFFMEIILYFLGMFPIFTLSTSFPIVAITLQNNLKTLFLDPLMMDQYGFVVKRLTFPTLAIAPPIAVALSTHDLGRLVEFTGSYAGTCIQYIIPAMLVLQARKYCRRDIGANVRNRYASPFKNVAWIYFVVCWSLICVILVSINLFSS